MRYNSKLVNKEFLNHLANHALKPDVCGLYKTIITQVYEAATGEEKTDLALYKRQLNECHEKITKGRELLLKGDLDAADYRNVKGDCERQVAIIEAKLVELYIPVFICHPSY